MQRASIIQMFYHAETGGAVCACLKRKERARDDLDDT
jgi:hypothetical protein